MFKVGDNVRVRNSHYDAELVGLEGVVKIVRASGNLGVYFPELAERRRGHSCNRRLATTFGGWWIDDYEVEKIEVIWPPKKARKDRYRGMNLEIVS